jgi:inhibitor of KinA
MERYTIFALGEQAVTFSLENKISQDHHQRMLAMQKWLLLHSVEGILDIVIAYNSLTILFDFYILRKSTDKTTVFEYVREVLMQAYDQTNHTARVEQWPVKRIPVCYEGLHAPDIHYLSTLKKIAVENIIELHTARIYHVYMIGFLPGFPYMAEVDARIATPRKSRPQQNVVAGSIGIAGIQTGIYSFNSPGGWQIIGRTPYKIFDKDKNPPVMLEPGDQVQFYAISKNEFEDFTRNQS